MLRVDSDCLIKKWQHDVAKFQLQVINAVHFVVVVYYGITNFGREVPARLSGNEK